MPNFTFDSWSSFKQQFMSVLDWLLYSLDLLYDSFRSKPLLYLFVFFPIFALLFFGVLNILVHLVQLKPLFENSDIKNDNSMLKTPSGRGAKNTAKGINLATAQKQQSRAAVQSVHAATAKANPFNSPGSASVRGSSGSGVNMSGAFGGSSHSSPGSVSGSSGSNANSTSYGNGAAYGVGGLINKAVDKYKKDKAEAAKAQEQAEKEAERQRVQAEKEKLAHDRQFNYVDHLYFRKNEEDDGYTTTRVTLNEHTNEIAGVHVTVKHQHKRNSDSEETKQVDHPELNIFVGDDE